MDNQRFDMKITVYRFQKNYSFIEKIYKNGKNFNYYCSNVVEKVHNVILIAS